MMNITVEELIVLIMAAACVLVALICICRAALDQYRAYMKRHDLDVQEQLVRDAWRAIKVERQRFIAEQQLNREAFHALDGMFKQAETDIRNKVNACRLNHPSGHGGNGQNRWQ